MLENVCSPSVTCQSRDSFELTVDVVSPMTNYRYAEDINLFFS
jgi:hypothetical protein